MNSPETTISEAIKLAREKFSRPIVVALDGGSGSGKSTIANRLQQLMNVSLVQLDDFYQTQVPEAEWPRKSVKQRLEGAFDWIRVRKEAIEPLLAGRSGRWRAFDFLRGLSAGGTYHLRTEFTEVAPAPVILLEGAYSASPPLRNLIDLAVLIDVPVKERHLRATERHFLRPGIPFGTMSKATILLLFLPPDLLTLLCQTEYWTILIGTAKSRDHIQNASRSRCTESDR